MRSLPWTCAVLVCVAACGSSNAPGSDGGSDGPTTGPDGSRNPCDGLGCASGPGRLTIHVFDTKTLGPVADPKFTEATKTLTPACQDPDAGADGGSSCEYFTFPYLGIGPHTIEVTATGYQPVDVMVQIDGPKGCCGLGPDVDAIAPMQK